MHGGWSGPDVANTPAVVAMVGIDTLLMGYDAPLDYVDECPAWDSGYQREIIDSMTVYYGGDLCGLDESDWDNPYDIASADDPQPMVVFNVKLFSDDVWPIRLCRFERKRPCWHYRFLWIRGCRWLPRLFIRIFDGLRTNCFLMTNGRTKFRDFPCGCVVC